MAVSLPHHGVDYRQDQTPNYGGESMYEGILEVSRVGRTLGLKKEDSMASVNVDDLWLVFPELTPASTDDSVGVREQQFANDVRYAAEAVRMNNSYDRLRWEFEDASIGSPARSGEVKEAV